AYAIGDRVAFARSPDLHTAAHEAAHVIQQRGGVQLADGVGRSGDMYERHADAVADRVVRGESAEALLNQVVVGAGAGAARRRDGHVAVQRRGEGEEASTPPPEDQVLASPPPATLSVQFHGLVFTPAQGARWLAGMDKALQGVAIAVKALAGGRYTSALAREALGFLRGASGGFQGTAELEGRARQGEDIAPFTFSLGLSLELIHWLRDEKKLALLVTQDRIEKLLLGRDVETAWSIVHRAQPRLPPWYSDKLFRSQILAEQHQPRILDFRARLAGFQAAPGPATARAVDTSLGALVGILRPDAELLDRVRSDPTLTDHGIYRGLWQLPAVDRAHPRIAPVADDSQVDDRMAGLFFQQARTSPAAAARARGDGSAASTARRALLDGMLGAAQERGAEEVSTGDAELRDATSRANAPPVPSSLAAYPGLPPPFEVASSASHAFQMRLVYPTTLEGVTAHLANHYTWELIRIPNDAWAALERTAEDEKARGYRPSWTDVARQGAARQMSYVDADREKVRGATRGLEATLGPVSAGAESLVAANRGLAVVGEVMRTFIRRITQPVSEQTIAFEKPGLYVVRCRVNGKASDDARFIRATSVAWHPVFARKPEAMARAGLELELDGRARGESRLREIEAELAGGALAPAERTALEEERRELRISLHGSVEAVLLGEQQALEERRRQLGADRVDGDGARTRATEDELAAIDRRLGEIAELLHIRRVRHQEHGASGLEGPVRIPAVFVGDDGRKLSLTLEALEKPRKGDQCVYHVTDATTVDSSQRTGEPRASRADAIADAVERLLEKASGYGRGHVTIHIPAPAGPLAALAHVASGPPMRTIRIDADLAAIAMEGIDNLTTALSVAAVAAAPFTGGASLAILLPVAAMGAIPSAYRLADRASAATLRLDLAAAMDIVNLVGSAAGIAQLGTGLRHVSVGGGLMMIGLGSDGLGVALAGAQFLEAAASIDPNAPPGVRHAMLMELVGEQLLGAGLQVGISLARRARTIKAQHAGAGADG
ncbi:MAG TPA: hypothetical protein VK698_33035, partial [Kofleriaceae bacterium]|nr:hypothetical protein [Kofleriaceae bacterium]